ncbi:MAG: hypothetical protein Q9190_002855 [Brigantiaea leucoxantha]
MTVSPMAEQEKEKEKKPRFQLPKPVARTLEFIKSQLPDINFITLHYYYYIGTCLLASVIFWGSSKPHQSISYMDSLFCVVSAMTLAGLNSVNLSQMNTFQQFILFLLLLLGSAIFISMAVVFVRLKAFEKRFGDVVEKERRKRRERGGGLRRRMTLRQGGAPKQTGADINGGLLRDRSTKSADHTEQAMNGSQPERGRISPITEESSDRDEAQHRTRHPLTINTQTSQENAQIGGAATPFSPSGPVSRGRRVTFTQSPIPTSPVKTAPLARILSMQGVGARHDLSNYPIRDLKRSETLRSSTPATGESKESWGDLIHHFKIPGFIGRNSQFSQLTIKQRDRIGGIEWRALVILAIVVPLYFVSWQVLASIAMGAWVNNNGKNLTEENGLNPWWVGAFTAVSGFNNSGMMLLDANMIGNDGLNNSLTSGTRVIDGFFQALAVRSGGFYVVTVSALRIGILILYAIMMYISVYPVVITMRNSNVYEERSLGVYSEEKPSSDEEQQRRPLPQPNSKKGISIGIIKRALTNQPPPGDLPESRGYFVRQQVRGQLAHDLWWVVLAVLLITITETSQFERDPVTYSVFNIIFEVISAYGCVGISIGLPNEAYSFSGGWHKLSKLILCAVMIRGRHRGLPVAIDRAVLLPGDHLAEAEEEDALKKLERSETKLNV